MSSTQSSPLEVTQALRDRAIAAHFRFGEDTAIVAVQHMLQQTVDLFRTIGAMGLNLKNVFALGKIYSNSSPMITTLREMGVTVVETTVPEPGEFHSSFERDIERLWHIAADRLAERQVKRILVLDDAGVCIRSVPEDLLQRYAVCGVEQTSSGMFLFEEESPPVPVISWARAAVKLEIGGPVFSQTFMDKLNSEFLRGKSLQGKQIGIIGLGSIGKGIAHLLTKQVNEVLFYDTNPDLQVPSNLQKRITRVDTLEELMSQCDYVMGCSGRNPFQRKWPLHYKPRIKLLSASGGDQEFGPIIKDLVNKLDFKVANNTWDISATGPSGPIEIAYLGYPYNFVSRGHEAVPARIVQLETGGLLAALMQARIHLDRAKNSDCYVHRVAPKAQRFVYESWLRAMKARNINIVDRFGYDPETLQAAQHDRWFIEKTEPHPDKLCRSLQIIEEMMSLVICQDGGSRLKGQPEANFSAVSRH